MAERCWERASRHTCCGRSLRLADVTRVCSALGIDGAVQEDVVELKLKTISKDGIAEAISKAELYRYLNEPEESESICHDILAADPENQTALLLLGLAITDEFTGESSDRYAEAESVFLRLSDAYEQQYCLGLLCERQAKAQMQAGRPPHAVTVLFQEAMRRFEAAGKISESRMA